MPFFIFNTAVSALLAVAMGRIFLRVISNRRLLAAPAALGISFGLGMGIIALLELVFLILKQRISALPFLLACAAVMAALLAVKRNNYINTGAKEQNERLNVLSIILITALTAQWIWIIIQSLNMPIFSDDGIAIWGLKAKNVHYAGILGWPFSEMAQKMRYTLSGNYPLLFPLSENYMNILCGAWNDLYPKMVSPLYYLAFILSFYGVLKKFTDRNYSVIFSFFLATLPFMCDNASVAIADLQFSYYYSLSFMLIIIWAKEADKGYIVLSSIFTALFIFTKNEGYPGAFFNALALLMLAPWRTDRKNAVSAICVFFSITAPAALLTAYYQHLTGIQEGIINSQTLSISRLLQNIDKIPYILYEFQRQLLGTPNKWNLLGHLFAVSLIIGLRKLPRQPYLSIVLTIMMNFLLYTAVYVLSPHELKYHMGTSQYRVVLHFAPLMLFFSSLVIYQRIKKQS